VDDLQPGERNNIVMLTDVSTVRETERMLRQVSLYDPTTALPNRTLFEQEVNKVLGHTNPEITSLHLLLMDIDSFGLVNEALGYETADKVLRHLAQKLQDAVGVDELLSRHTSDMFVLLASDAASPTDVAGLIAQLKETFHEPIELEGHRFNLSLSIGVSKYPEDGETCDELLRTANVALQHAKQRGGNTYTFYHRGEEAISRRFVELAGPLRDGLQKHEFNAAFQPIIDSETGEVVSMEALARWTRPDGTAVGPNEFIPVAECSGAIRQIFETILRQSCRQLRKLDQAGHPGLHASVNLSPRQFMDPGLSETLLTIIDEERLTPDRIYIEITENQLMDDPKQKGKILGALQERGIKVIIDDFGTGYSSFGYLKHFDVDGIKLDRMFVKDLPRDKKGGKIASMIIGMGRELDIPVVAEGVETHTQADFLRKHHCAHMQGFLFAKPMPAEEFDAFLDKHKP
jgi:diguanylate cyclase (GGDEF)-like protein